MKWCRKSLSISVLLTVVVLLGTSVAAQDEEFIVVEREHALQAAQLEEKMHAAERQMEEAARQIAELSRAQIAGADEFSQQWVFDNSRPVLGITISSSGESGPVKGAAVIGVTPGGAADEAGIRSGDIITALNGESLGNSSGSGANEQLLELMQKVDEGEEIELDYLRGNKKVTVKMVPEVAFARVFDFRFDSTGPMVAPGVRQMRSFAWMGMSGGHGFGEMEMVELNKSLGRYFGTDAGLLIVKAPEDNAFQLQDGDVLKSIDGREPKDLLHAIRILSSYESGETVNLQILRDKKKKTITVQVPDDRQSLERTMPSAWPRPVLMPGVTPEPAVIFMPRLKVLEKVEHST